MISKSVEKKPCRRLLQQAIIKQLASAYLVMAPGVMTITDLPAAGLAEAQVKIQHILNEARKSPNG